MTEQTNLEPREHAEKCIEGVKRAVVCISGGLDSPTVLGWLLENDIEVVTVAFDYGQIHDKELKAMANVLKYFNEGPKGDLLLRHLTLNVGFMRQIGGSALLDKNIDIPKGRVEEEMSNIPVTYVPGRNTMFIACGMSVAEAMNCDAVAVGVNHIDFSGYPDCRPDYIAEWNELGKLSSKRAVEGKPIKVIAPLQYMEKADIITFGSSFEESVPYQMTWSCYTGGDEPCGECDACILRNNGWKAHGMNDPSIKYWKEIGRSLSDSQ